MTPEQKAAVVGYFSEAQEAIDGTGRHEGHATRRVGRCLYCSCGWRIGQVAPGRVVAGKPQPPPPASYREAHTHGPRPRGDRQR